MDSAISLSVRGWKVFPCSPGSKIPLKGWTGWEGRATDDTDTVIDVWSETPDANIGLATGPSGLLVLDFDAAKGPEESSGIENFRNAYPARKLPGTYTVRTGSGGWHLYYRAAGLDLDGKAVDLRNSAGKLAERVDTRAQGGYVLAPGSMVDGNHYVCTNNLPLADVPEWLIQELADKPATRSNIKPRGNSSSYALAALRRECEALAEMAEGGRNHAANRAAWNVSRFVARDELDEDRAWNDLIAAGLACGLEARELQNALTSGMTRGIKHYAE